VTVISGRREISREKCKRVKRTVVSSLRGKTKRESWGKKSVLQNIRMTTSGKRSPAGDELKEKKDGETKREGLVVDAERHDNL